MQWRFPGMSIFFLEYAKKENIKRNLVVVLESKDLWYLQGNVSCQMYWGFWKCHHRRCQSIRHFNTSWSFLFFSFLYQLYTSRLKCLRAWHEYADSKRIQEDMKLLAERHRRLTLLKGRFQKWKKRVCCLFASREFFCGDDCKLNYVHYFSVHVQEKASGTDRTVAKESIW